MVVRAEKTLHTDANTWKLLVIGLVLVCLILSGFSLNSFFAINNQTNEVNVLNQQNQHLQDSNQNLQSELNNETTIASAVPELSTELEFQREQNNESLNMVNLFSDYRQVVAGVAKISYSDELAINEQLSTMNSTASSASCYQFMDLNKQSRDLNNQNNIALANFFVHYADVVNNSACKNAGIELQNSLEQYSNASEDFHAAENQWCSGYFDNSTYGYDWQNNYQAPYTDKLDELNKNTNEVNSKFLVAYQVCYS